MMRNGAIFQAIGQRRETGAGTPRLRLALCGMAALSPFVVDGAAWAQTSPTAQAAAVDTAEQAGAVDAVGVGEIVVTARHRSEDSQKVPAALSVVSGEFLEKTNTTNIAQVTQYIPSIQFTFFNARNANINIRGIGNNIGLANDGLDPGVGFYVDQVYYSRPATATLDLIDIERIEVLRGPQGTLFGKDTTAGAINIATAAPSFHPQAQAEVTGGDYSSFQAKGTVSGPLLGDKLAGRLSIGTTQRDGLLTNLHDGEKVNNYRNFTVRGQLLYTPTDQLKIRFIGDYANQFNHCCAQVLANIVTPSNGKNFRSIAQGFGYTPVVDPSVRQANVNSPFQARQETGGASVEVDYSLPKAVFTAITAWRFWNWWPKNDGDNAPFSAFLAGQNGDYENQLSQEFRIASAGDNRVDYVVGLYVYREQIKAIGLTQYGDAASAVLISQATPSIVLNGLNINYAANYNTDSVAGFGQVVWRITPQLNLTGGLRYTQDYKRGNFTQLASGLAPLTGSQASLAATRAAFAVNTAYNLKNTNANISGLVNLSYQVTPDVLAYVNVARGYKSGGLNLTQLPAGANPIVDPEQVNSAEIGVKTRLFDRRLVLNAALFWEDDRNYQANIFDQTILKLYLSNVPKVRSEGFEADIQAQPIEDLTLYGALTYDDAIYADYPGAPCGLEAITKPSCDLTGRPLAGTPRWAASAGGEYSHNVPLGAREAQAYLGVDYSYRSSLYSHASDSIYTRLPQLSLVNLRVGLRSDRWDGFFWAKNLGDAQYFTFLQPGSGNSGALYGQLGDPRTYGVTLRLKY
jgi:iron complex outermembrane receptor protein